MDTETTTPDRSVPDPGREPTITLDRVATILDLSRSSVYNAAHSGEIPTIRVGRRLLVPTAALAQMLQAPTGGGAS
jgi:excisionase family DNA binding protein